jgi:hypothetical protein
MGKSGQWFMQQRELEVDDSDYQYFQWLTEAQWQDAMEMEREKLQRMYGSGATFKIKFAEFLNKNHEL